MNFLENQKEGFVFTSKDIAMWTGKQHFNILRDTRDEVKKLIADGMRDYVELNFQFMENTNVTGIISNAYCKYTKIGIQQLAMRYDAIIRAKVNIKLEELENNSKIPKTFAEALRLAAELEEEKERLALENKTQKEQLTYQEPMVKFSETCLKSKDNILVRELAKIMSDKGFKIGEKRLYKKLREMGMVMKRSVEPYQQYVDMGIFVVEERNINTPFGIKLTRTLMISPKGQLYIIDKLRKKENIQLSMFD